MAFESLYLTSDGAGAVVYSAADFRQLISNMWTTGVLSGLAVSEQSAMNVQVAAGSAIVPSAANEGRYLAWETAATTGVTIGAAPVTVGQSRNDLVCLFTKDPAASGGTAGRVTVPVVVAGTAAATGSQVDPSVPAFHLALARVTVANGTAAITNAMITDLRSFATLAGDYVDDAQATRLGTSLGTASSLVRRTAAGEVDGVATPTSNTMAANKLYVDNELATVGDDEAFGDTLVRRDAGGRAEIQTPTTSGQIANKSYVDATATAAGTAAVTASVATLTNTAASSVNYAKTGNIVFVWGYVHGGFPVTLPAGYRPAVALNVPAVKSGVVLSQAQIATNGTVNEPTSGQSHFSAVFAAA